MRVKVANLRQPGQPIMFNYDGKQYELGDREVVNLPQKIIDHLAEGCVIKTFEQREVVGKDGQPKRIDFPVERPRFSVSPVARTYVSKDVSENDKK